MPQLKLFSLVCHGTEDWTGADEAYLLLNGQRIWGPESMNDNDVENLGNLPTYPFQNSVRIELYDQDTGGWDNDDHLGTTYARAIEAGIGEQERQFTGDGAHYTLTYSVMP